MKKESYFLEEKNTFLRYDLGSKYGRLLKETMKDMGIKCINHTLVRKLNNGTRLFSSAGTNEPWITDYWTKLMRDDRMEKVGHSISETGHLSSFSWSLLDQDPVMRERLSVNKCINGVTIFKSKKGNVFENYSFGWDDDRLPGDQDMPRFEKIIAPLQSEHRDTFSEN